ncbi:MAG: glycoside hydrolase family 3 C-terminal domain-containing protein [Bacteroidales bacterium]|nr:glycoside hydrolase family 3 C-terminal domain-containing protein [Bacteroidales bacterium]
MKTRLILSLMLVVAWATACGQPGQRGKQAAGNDVPVFLDDSKSIDERVEDALSRMTVEEKVAILHAQSKFSSAGVPRLGIPELWTTDGPHGIRPEVLWDKWSQAGWTSDSCTAFPALTALAASWDPDLAKLYGVSIGQEARYRKKDVLLGPGVNICRTPLNGRSFEYMGEDPFLSSTMVVPYVQGVQSNGVAACVKHYALNNQETNRFVTHVKVDDRTLYEIYLPAFKAAVQKGGAWAIMGSYNLYNGQWCCQNEYTLNGILKGEWGFDGVVISDWGGAHDTDQCVEHGLDLEFGTVTNNPSAASNTYANYYLASPYLEGVKSGKYDMKTLDDKARRVLRLFFRTVMDKNRPYGSFVSPEHIAAARKIGSESIVLLKNDGGVLPLKDEGRILVVGENAVKMMTVGGGSSSLKVKKEYSPLEGIRERFSNAEIVYERGYVGDVSGQFDGVSTGQDLDETRSAAQLIADAVAAAGEADCVIFIGGLNKSTFQDAEGADRQSYELPYGQDAVIEALAAVARKMVVINISGNAVAMPWAGKVPAIVQGWYLGSEAGHSLADVLSGDVNPSGKLPFTIGAQLSDYPARTEAQYPGIPRPEMSKMGLQDVTIYDEEYSEGIFVGYRWFDHESIAPTFAFGHGLSYTSFEIGDPKVSGSIGKGLTFSIPVTNTGKVAGAEVVQLYISAGDSAVERAPKELKGFSKVYLEPGKTATVKITIDKEAISYFDADKHEWVAAKGDYSALIGTSSDALSKTVEFKY